VGHTGPVLVVDDDPIVRGLICRALEEEGLAVLDAANGQLALEQASRLQPALVVLDVTLPVLSSKAAAAGVRALAGEHVPILVITADSHPTEKARNLGAYASLSKPFDVDELVSLVRRGLDGA
jgi:DNA-binding response OmpR family regulator